jgi:hypothetical protein
MKTIATLFVVLGLSCFTKAQTISTFAGNGVIGFSGDGGQATAAEFNSPASIALDSAGNILIADALNYCVRKVDAVTGIISTYAGIPLQIGYSGDGGPATAAEINAVWGIAADGHNNLYLAEYGHIRKVDRNGIITTAIGNGVNGYTGDGGPATAAEIDGASSVWADVSGSVFFNDGVNSVIRYVSPSGIINTLAGNGTTGYSGDGGPATAAELNHPGGVITNHAGTVYIADVSSMRVRAVSTSSLNISTVVGIGVNGYSGDGGQATAAEISQNINWCDMAFDSVGRHNIFIPDYGNNVIRQYNISTGIITTCAGNDINGYSGDGGPATAAELRNPAGAAVDKTGNLFIVDYGNNVIREVKGIPLGIKKLTSHANSSITVYPNPATNQLFVNLLGVEGKVNLQLFNEMGQQVMNSNVTGSQVVNLSVSGLATGLYIVKVTTEKGNLLVRKVDIIN